MMTKLLRMNYDLRMISERLRFKRRKIKTKRMMRKTTSWHTPGAAQASHYVERGGGNC